MPKDKQQELIHRGIIEYIRHRKIDHVILKGSKFNTESIYQELSSAPELNNVKISIERSNDYFKQTSDLNWIIDSDELVYLYNRGMMH